LVGKLAAEAGFTAGYAAMDLAPDGFGADKLDDSGRPTNGYTFPRDMELPAKDELTGEKDLPSRRERRAAPVELPAPGGNGSAAASLPPVPAVLTSPDHDWFRPRDGSPADHPMMRGLLLELPPRTAPLDPAWVEQWLEAARAALGLIYARTDGPTTRR
jgi:hypothetical protein